MATIISKGPETRAREAVEADLARSHRALDAGGTVELVAAAAVAERARLGAEYQDLVIRDACRPPGAPIPVEDAERLAAVMRQLNYTSDDVLADRRAVVEVLARAREKREAERDLAEHPPRADLESDLAKVDAETERLIAELSEKSALAASRVQARAAAERRLASASAALVSARNRSPRMSVPAPPESDL